MARYIVYDRSMSEFAFPFLVYVLGRTKNSLPIDERMYEKKKKCVIHVSSLAFFQSLRALMCDSSHSQIYKKIVTDKITFTFRCVER